MKLPKRITPCPIEEAIIELRFDSAIPHDAIFGIIYQQFKDKFPRLENLQMVQIPEPIRSSDPLLAYKPYYKISNDVFSFNIGPKVISLTSVKNYVGWVLFSKEINECIKKLVALGIFAKIKRLGLRYINFFEEDIFNNIKLEVKLNSERLSSDSLYVRSAIRGGKFINNLQITNKAKLKQKDGIKVGSVIDIDAFLEKEIGIDEINCLIEEAHSEEKELFFSLLSKEFLDKLNPEY